MNGLNMQAVRDAAAYQLHQENFARAVAAEKAKLIERGNQSFWQQLFKKLPFTITIKRR